METGSGGIISAGGVPPSDPRGIGSGSPHPSFRRQTQGRGGRLLAGLHEIRRRHRAAVRRNLAVGPPSIEQIYYG
jgi:hypothetical protein